MRLTSLCLAVLTIGLAPALARGPAPKKPEIVPGQHVQEQLTHHGTYVNKRGREVHAPAHHVTGGVPDGATARCGDGTHSFSHSRTGTCSRHGGVSAWLR